MVHTLSISSVDSRILTLPILWSLTAPLPAGAASATVQAQAAVAPLARIETGNSAFSRRLRK